MTAKTELTPEDSERKKMLPIIQGLIAPQCVDDPEKAWESLKSSLDSFPDLHIEFYTLEPEPEFSLQHPDAVPDHNNWNHAFYAFLKAAPVIAKRAAEIKKKYGASRANTPPDKSGWKGYS